MLKIILKQFEEQGIDFKELSPNIQIAVIKAMKEYTDVFISDTIDKIKEAFK